jgi:hypothetical protein
MMRSIASRRFVVFITGNIHSAAARHVADAASFKIKLYRDCNCNCSL